MCETALHFPLRNSSTVIFVRGMWNIFNLNPVDMNSHVRKTTTKCERLFITLTLVSHDTMKSSLNQKDFSSMNLYVRKFIWNEHNNNDILIFDFEFFFCNKKKV